MQIVILPTRNGRLEYVYNMLLEASKEFDSKYLTDGVLINEVRALDTSLEVSSPHEIPIIEGNGEAPPNFPLQDRMYPIYSGKSFFLNWRLFHWLKASILQPVDDSVILCLQNLFRFSFFISENLNITRIKIKSTISESGFS